MGAHSTMTITRSAALQKLKAVDWDDIPTKELENVLDRLLYDTLYNFTVIEDDRAAFYEGEVCHSIEDLRVPSLGESAYWNLTEDQRQTYDRLKDEGYSASAIMILLNTG